MCRKVQVWRPSVSESAGHSTAGAAGVLEAVEAAIGFFLKLAKEVKAWQACTRVDMSCRAADEACDAGSPCRASRPAQGPFLAAVAFPSSSLSYVLLESWRSAMGGTNSCPSLLGDRPLLLEIVSKKNCCLPPPDGPPPATLPSPPSPTSGFVRFFCSHVQPTATYPSVGRRCARSLSCASQALTRSLVDRRGYARRLTQLQPSARLTLIRAGFVSGALAACTAVTGASAVFSPVPTPRCRRRVLER